MSSGLGPSRIPAAPSPRWNRLAELGRAFGAEAVTELGAGTFLQDEAGQEAVDPGFLGPTSARVGRKSRKTLP